MAWNRGKDFELKVREQLESYDKCDLLRLYDVMTGYLNIKNPSDLIVYQYPIMLYWDCKSLKGNTLNFNELTQLENMLDHSKRRGVIAGFFIWYIDHKETYWVDADFINALKQSGEYKSLNIKHLRVWCKLDEHKNKNVILVESKTPRIFPVYNFESFFNTINVEDNYR